MATFSGVTGAEPRQALADDWLGRVFQWAVAGTGQGTARARRGEGRGILRAKRERPSADGPDKGLVLVAVGSLGRGELVPDSDLDLVLINDGRPDVSEVADRLWYPIWDDPMPLDHSVRSLSQVAQAAESDLRVAQGLLDARPLVGDEELGFESGRLGRRLWEKRVATWLPAVLDARSACPGGPR